MQIHFKQYLLANGLGFATAILITILAISGGNRTDPMPVFEEEIIPGIVELSKSQTISLRWKRVVLRRCDSLTTGRLTDSRGLLHYYAPIENKFSETDEKSLYKLLDYSRELILPEILAPGKVKLDVYVEYVCNWTNRIWPIKIDRNPAYFEVVRQ